MAAKETSAAKAGAKTTGKKAAAKIPAVLDASPCDQRGSEFPGNVFAHPGQRLDAFFLICAAAAELRVSVSKADPNHIGGILLFSGRIPPAPNPLVVTLPPLPQGKYIVSWTYRVAGPWKVVAELLVDGVARFRKINSIDDGLPVEMIWCFVEIV